MFNNKKKNIEFGKDKEFFFKNKNFIYFFIIILK